MARITITTLVPAGTEISLARSAARIAAAEQLNLHIVEESCPPVSAMIPGTVVADEAIALTHGVPVGVEVKMMVPSPADHTVDRNLVTVWDYIDGKTGGQ